MGAVLAGGKVHRLTESGDETIGPYEVEARIRFPLSVGPAATLRREHVI